VWNIINPPAPAHYYKVDNPKQGHALIEQMANLQLTQPTIECNVFGLQVWADEGWEDWYNDEGQDVDDAFAT
jgi:hypothetical protein